MAQIGTQITGASPAASLASAIGKAAQVRKASQEAALTAQKAREAAQSTPGGEKQS